MPYWLDWQKKNNTFQLTNDLDAILLAKEAIPERLGLELAFSLSFDKWQRILLFLEKLRNEPLPLRMLNSFSKRIGAPTCALCVYAEGLYEEKYGKTRFGSDKCKVCPLARIDQCTKKNSVFSRFEEITLKYYIDESPELENSTLQTLAELGSKMIENLKLVSEA